MSDMAVLDTFFRQINFLLEKSLATLETIWTITPSSEHDLKQTPR
jgi:hypothetical protein